MRDAEGSAEELDMAPGTSGPELVLAADVAREWLWVRLGGMHRGSRALRAATESATVNEIHNGARVLRLSPARSRMQEHRSTRDTAWCERTRPPCIGAVHWDMQPVCLATAPDRRQRCSSTDMMCPCPADSQVLRKLRARTLFIDVTAQKGAELGAHAGRCNDAPAILHLSTGVKTLSPAGDEWMVQRGAKTRPRLLRKSSKRLCELQNDIAGLAGTGDREGIRECVGTALEPIVPTDHTPLITFQTVGLHEVFPPRATDVIDLIFDFWL
ncbi:hypothetical protein DFH06DRAFT_1135436 [Mycena polygramma]|nr:hypothetical protein DFH06DRAFT_1135436 [Mycena polygramma]